MSNDKNIITKTNDGYVVEITYPNNSKDINVNKELIENPNVYKDVAQFHLLGSSAMEVNNTPAASSDVDNKSNKKKLNKHGQYYIVTLNGVKE